VPVVWCGSGVARAPPDWGVRDGVLGFVRWDAGGWRQSRLADGVMFAGGSAANALAATLLALGATRLAVATPAGVVGPLLRAAALSNALLAAINLLARRGPGTTLYDGARLRRIFRPGYAAHQLLGRALTL